MQYNPSWGFDKFSSASNQGTNLEAEFFNTIHRARLPRVAPMLAELGLSRRVQWGLSLVRVRGSHYEPAAGNHPRSSNRDVYVPEAGADFAIIAPVVVAGELIDLCAIRLATGRPATRLGIGAALGEDEIDRARWDERSLHLVETPLDWLREPRGRACLISTRPSPLQPRRHRQGDLRQHRAGRAHRARLPASYPRPFDSGDTMTGRSDPRRTPAAARSEGQGQGQDQRCRSWNGGRSRLPAELQRLSRLSEFAYQRERQKVAERFGVKLTFLDGQVKAARKAATNTACR